MKIPSRRMPPVQRPATTPMTGLVLCFSGALLLGTFVLMVVLYPVGTVLFCAGFVALIVVGQRAERSRLAAIVATRQADSICTFARSFPRRQVDTRLIRAVYEEIGCHLDAKRRFFPVRATDSLLETLRIDSDDLDEIARDVAFRAGRSLENPERNPLYGKVETPGTLVQFFMLQPEVA